MYTSVPKHRGYLLSQINLDADGVTHRVVRVRNFTDYKIIEIINVFILGYTNVHPFEKAFDLFRNLWGALNLERSYSSRVVVNHCLHFKLPII